MEIDPALKTIFIETAKKLKGSDRRIFMARTVKFLDKGGQRYARSEFHWDPKAINKGMHELESGFRCCDNFSARGRKLAEEHLPNLLNDIKSIVDGQSQTGSNFKSTRLYTRLSAAEVRRQLIAQKGYKDAELPSGEAIRTKLNKLGYHPARVRKTRPLKKIPETDAIFEQLHKENTAADNDETVLRISMDAKASVLVGPFSRGGKTRIMVKALDHDFQPDEKLSLFGFLLPKYPQVSFYFSNSPVTSDFIVDCLREFWLSIRKQFPKVKTILLNQDNGPENHSRRTQFMKRITELADEFQLTFDLAYYPPYHSKYNPVERTWGVLEKHWNGDLLDSVNTVLNFAKTMTWKMCHPIVRLIKNTYETGVKLTQKEMNKLEKRFIRLPDLKKWFLRITPVPQ